MTAAAPLKHRVLFVCMGNICRSPAAEIIFGQLVAASGRSGDFEIDSAGTIDDHCGNPPDPRMAAALSAKGYTICGAARQLCRRDLQHFDLIVAMDEANLTTIQKLDRSGQFSPKIRPLVSFCTVHDDLRVADPYYGGQRGFEQVIALLEDGCAGILAHFPA
jgi:protein-tyrosine phosphatase